MSCVCLMAQGGSKSVSVLCVSDGTGREKVSLCLVCV